MVDVTDIKLGGRMVKFSAKHLPKGTHIWYQRRFPHSKAFHGGTGIVVSEPFPNTYSVRVASSYRGMNSDVVKVSEIIGYQLPRTDRMVKRFEW